MDIKKGQRFLVTQDLDLDPGTMRFNRLFAGCEFIVKRVFHMPRINSTRLVDIKYASSYGKWAGVADMIGLKLLQKLIEEGKIVEDSP